MLKKSALAIAVVACLAPIQTIAADSNNVTMTPRIVGGSAANQADWGFYTQLVSRDSNRSFCGGSYLGNGYVLTAAHCVVGNVPKLLSVKVGGYRFDTADGQRADVSKVFVHPNFNIANLDNDIAVLKLDRKLPNAVAVEIAEGSLSQYVRNGDMLTVAGLGRIKEGGASPTVLQQVSIPLVSDAVCREAGGSYNNVDAVMFCAGYPKGGKDACNGDSGGPIIFDEGGVVTQLGLVSWGEGCARVGRYGVYTDIAALRPWVDSIIYNDDAELVAVGYAAAQTLDSFSLGDLKKHSFKITNSGNVEFTVNKLTTAASGVANTPQITNDSCTATTLQPKSSCTVAVEFGAKAVGTAKASLKFNIDKSTTAYEAQVSAPVIAKVVVIVPPPGVKVYVRGPYYPPGIKVLNDKEIYQCKAFPFGAWCSAYTHEPGKGKAWQTAWIKL